MNAAGQNKVDVTDYRGKRVIFTERRWRRKSTQHTELCDPAFIGNIEQALLAPDEVWEDYNSPTNKHCYYKRFGVNLYAKVVVWVADNPGQIVTAFETNVIKEANYAELKRLL